MNDSKIMAQCDNTKPHNSHTFLSHPVALSNPESTFALNQTFLCPGVDAEPQIAGVMKRLHYDSLDALDEEVRRARTKFPGNRFLFTALVEEVGELARAILQRSDPEHIRKEALQCACVAMRIYEERDPIYDDLTGDEAKP